MSYNPFYDLTGKKVSDTYHWLLQSGSDGLIYDGDGNSVTINATIPDIYATTGSNIFRGNQTITGSIYIDAPGTDSIYFSGSGPAGRLVWNDTDGTLDLGLKGNNVTLQIGQEQVTRVVNKTGINLTEAGYQAVKITGAQGSRLKVGLALADSDANSTDTIGLVTENIDDNQEGFITTSGLVRNIDTTGNLQGETWNDGDVLYLSPTVAGRVTNVKPQAPQHTVIMGFVVRAQQNQGSIYVKVDNGYELDELHNVRITTASLAPGDLLVRGANNGGVWINSKQLTGSYALTGSLIATSLTGSLFGTSSWATNASTASFAPDYVLTSSTGSMLAPYVLTSQTSSMTVLSSSYAATASFVAQSDLRTLRVPYVIYTDYTPESTTSNSNTNPLSTFTLTVADADWPLGGVLRLSGLAERTAGTGNTTTGITINGSTARYFTGTGTNIQWEWQIMKEADTLRIGMGPSNTGNGSYQVHNVATVTATASGGNYVFTFYMFAVTAGATATMRWMKGLMIP